MAMSVQANQPASDIIMSPLEMKPLLMLSKRQPVYTAIGITGDGEGVILLNKRMKSKRVLATLKAEAAKAKIQLQPSTLRFGKAEVDTDYDPGMVRFFLNKESPGNLRLKLLTVIKRVPYQRVEVNVDPSFEDEAEDAAEEPETSLASATGVAPPPMLPDAKALLGTLAQLALAIPKVAGGNAGVQNSLVALAEAAGGSLKAKDLAKAAEGIEGLRHALAAAMEQAKAPAPSTGSVVVYAKSRLAWLAVRRKLETDMDNLRQHLLDFYQDADIAEDLDTRYGERVTPVLATLDEALADTLDAASNATDPGQRGRLVAESRAIIRRYQDFVASEEIFGELDANPFVPMAIGKTMTTTLATLAAAVH